MPWGKGDVEKHKKGLSDKQKEKWVKIANGALASCIKKGKKEGECATSAIRIANSMVGNSADQETLNFNESFAILENVKIRTEVLDKKLHLVVPVIMLVEGVHNQRLYLDEDLSNAPESWNGRPVVVTHPKEGEEAISANSSPELVEKTRIGTIFNSVYEDKKLKAEIWIDVDKAMSIAPEILSIINNSKPLEVSTGLWFSEEDKEGDWNGEQYYAIARHYKPDHLALLPNEKGACSWKDGCGVRRNKEVEGNTIEIADGELSFYCIIDKMYQMLAGNPNEVMSSSNYRRLKDVYSDYFTYEDNSGNLYKQGYKISKKGEIVLKGDGEKVSKIVSYETSSEQKINSEISLKKEAIVDKKQKIEYILGTKQMEYNEKSLTVLEALSDSDLDWQYKMAEKFRNCKSCNGEPSLITNEEEPKKVPATVQEYIKDAPSEYKDLITNGVRMHNERKAMLVKALIENKRNKFSLEKLNQMPIDELESLTSLAQIEIDFTGQGGSFEVAALKINERQPDGSGVPDAPEMKWEPAVSKNRSRS